MPPVQTFSVQVAADYAEMSGQAARWVMEDLREKPRLLLCAATGASPVGAYQQLARAGGDHPSLFEHVRVLKLDEWGGLAMNDPGSCESFLQKRLLHPLRIDPSRYFGFQSNPKDPEAECQRVEAWLETNGPIDVCILGLGLNGHLALNEPGDQLQPFCHVATLTEQSLRHGMLSDCKTPPRFGLTLGMMNILNVRKILLLVSGERKHEALRRLLRPEISTHFPASFLWLHRSVTCLCDREAFGHGTAKSAP